MARNLPTYAHFPGGGPDGMVCMSCEHRHQKDRKHRKVVYSAYYCRKAAELARTKTSCAIDIYTAACKYWQLATEGNPL